MLPNVSTNDRSAWVLRVRELELQGFRVRWSVSVEQVGSSSIASRVYIEATCPL